MSLQLTACVSLAPTYTRPALPVSATYAENDAGEPYEAATAGWRGYFQDAGLQSLIALALRNNRDMQVAVARVDEARAAYGIERAAEFPSIGAQAEVDRSRVPADLNLTGKPLVGSQYQVGLGMASWELDFWGRVRSLKDAALENYLATDAARRAVGIDLVAQVAISYLTLSELNERLFLAGQTLASRVESYRIFSRRVDVGSTSRLDLSQVEVLLTQAQALVAQLEQDRATQVHRLTLLAGSTLPTAILQQRLSAVDMPAGPRAGLPSDLLTNRPDIVAAEHRLKAAHANIGAARAAFFPRIALTGSIGTASAELDGLFGSGSRAWAFSPSLSLPLFDGGLRRNNLSLSEARRDIAVSTYEKTVQSAFRDVSDALSAHRWLTRQVEIAQATLAAQSERARLSVLRYNNGAAAFLEVLDAQRDLLTAQQQLVQLQRAVATSSVSLYAAIGGGAEDDGLDNKTTSDNPS
ncbi:efflux transporter outer membrane subunit [Herbaspirillum sp. RV1423]|uniref:efflux transporter outer membrane subunit n=1 Tax=Herbaspirillum sp. RV1423 TaxID=1443993 RepID=UPI0005599573|nr:efflux transporter outer membrane subunit [Herbaspirillum sp. RV1423]